MTTDALREHVNELDWDSLKELEQASLLKISQSLTEPLTQNDFKWCYETKIKVLLNWRSKLWELIHIFPGEKSPHLETMTCLLTHEPSLPSWTSSNIQPGWLQQCRARPSEMFTFQRWVVFNHAAGCLTAHSTAWPLFTSPCFRPALYAQSGRPRDDLSGQLLRFSVEQRHGQAVRKAAWRYTENAPVWLTQSA